MSSWLLLHQGYGGHGHGQHAALDQHDPQLAARKVCDGCGNVYKHAQSLWKHRRFECGKEPSFCCPYCSLRFKRAAHLRRHVGTVHQGFPMPSTSASTSASS
ncbi:hypothetical protein ONE63_006229 [Megalurothrips usitatus]|uniref:C2H2-type domain-containing protein n=1 Tax=Megalurothrips usitatus TaxID=439358 RepID=A0AAV7XVC0_9NEOP|nr:hypothetical protein ONE63_006229 [Megalurothrips usitatus]